MVVKIAWSFLGPSHLEHILEKRPSGVRGHARVGSQVVSQQLFGEQPGVHHFVLEPQRRTRELEAREVEAHLARGVADPLHDAQATRGLEPQGNAHARGGEAV